MNYDNRPVAKEDFQIIATFPQNESELFFIYPKWNYPVQPEQMEEVASQRYNATVITHNQEVVGYCNLYNVTEREHGYLGNVIIAPDYRGQGAAAYLINVMKQKAKQDRGVRQLRLMCHNINTRALLFYNKMGFKPFDFKELLDKQGNKLVLLELAIDVEGM
ncbi:GNAT family N-acetyltransferase [Paenibacillus sp. RC67]|uniref:GNAT family N-acetyltransferase n=1 Tax=Paenibacillus sp. RC67 TaxID=3039392 RepID=UPI0024AD2E21|nr:GNAT family N-acetyltransferase [Paenibacillus sp. RC67]